MKRPLSALAAIGGFSIAIAALSVATTASIVLLMPDPPAIRVTVAEAAAELRGAPGSLERTVGPEPQGPPADLLREVLARELGRPASAVRVVWLDQVPKTAPSRVILFTSPRTSTTTPIKLTLRREGTILPPGSAVLPRGIDSVRLATAVSTNALLGGILLTLPQPAFAAAVQRADGRWVTVAPRRPIFGGWRLKVLAALAASLLLLAPLAWLFARRLTRPFRALAAAVERGSEPPALDGPRELREAAGAIVDLRTRLAHDADERMRMLTAVAHDLRTPLTSLKLRIEAVPEPARSRMAADADRMGAMIHDVLAFARAAQARRIPVAIRPLLLDIIESMPGPARYITMSDGPDATVVVVEDAFRRALENLLRNAIDHAGGGRVDVAEDDSTVSIEIADSGPGIAAGDRERLIRPFERGDASRNRDTGGTGLGLSIVQSFVDLHGGTLTLADAAMGGTMVTMRLPVTSEVSEVALG